MAESPDDVAPLFTAVQLVRLRDRLRGTTRLDYSRWLEPMAGPELDLRDFAANVVRGRRKPSPGRKGEQQDLLLWRLAFFERDFALWRNNFANETDTITKFLNLLANLQLNVSPELEELKSLIQRNEYVQRGTERFSKRISSIAAGDKTIRIDDDPPIYRELLAIAGSLEKLRARVDEKADDAVRLISLMTTSIDSQTLVDLLTGEV